MSEHASGLKSAIQKHLHLNSIGGQSTHVQMVEMRSPFALNPFRTAVPFWGQTTQISSSLSPKRDCGFEGVKELDLSEQDL